MRRFPVETVAAESGAARPHVALTSELWNEYQTAGVSRSEAGRLLRAGVNPDDLWVWLDVLGTHTTAERIVVLANAGVTSALLREYPRMNDPELTAMVYRKVPPAVVHGYGHVFGWCCQRPPAGSPTNATWMVVPELYRLQVSTDRLSALMEALSGRHVDVGLVPSLFEMRVPVALTVQHAARYGGLRPLNALRVEWKAWVEAADGHVKVADAVASAGGQISEVSSWLATGETPERIAALVRTGSSASVITSGGYTELTDDDLAVWAALTADS